MSPSAESPASASDLAHLVEYTHSVDADQTIRAVDAAFRATGREYAAVTSNHHVTGLIGRHHVASMLSGRYGFDLHNRAPVRHHLASAPLIVDVGAPLHELLERALSRTGDAFYQDVVLVTSEMQLVGLVSTQRLVVAQSAMVRDQLRQLESQQTALELANAELADSLRQQRDLERRIVAREKTELIETLVGGIAHEINNKLTPIAGFAELLKEGDPEFPEYCRMIHDAALDASRIIRQLLQLSRPVATQHDICDVREIVEESVRLLRLRMKEANIECLISGTDQPILISADATQIKQVVMNLVLNAIDATEDVSHRQLRVTTGIEAANAVIEVSDNGIGIAPSQIERIFDPFFTTKAPNQGTGLGLSVSASIMRLHDGDITVRSSSGRGTTFRITLPLTDLRTAAGCALRDESARVQHEGLRALVVEDDDAVAALVTRVLQRQLACDVLRVGDGAAARDALASAAFDLIISDVRMPRATGVDLLRWIQEERPALLRRLLFVTGDASGSVLNVALTEAGVKVLPKPMTAAALLAHARAILQNLAEDVS